MPQYFSHNLREGRCGLETYVLLESTVVFLPLGAPCSLLYHVLSVSRRILCTMLHYSLLILLLLLLSLSGLANEGVKRKGQFYFYVTIAGLQWIYVHYLLSVSNLFVLFAPLPNYIFFLLKSLFMQCPNHF